MNHILNEALSPDIEKIIDEAQLEALMIQILKEEVKPATGCTEPVAVAFATAQAKAYMANALGEALVLEALASNAFEVVVMVSPNLFKNGLGVGIPNCEARGLHVAAALGLLACDGQRGLKVFESMQKEAVEASVELVKGHGVTLGILDTEDKIRVEVILKLAGHELKLILRGLHDHIEEVTLDQSIIFKAEAKEGQNQTDKELFYGLSIRELVTAVERIDTGTLDFLLEGLQMNRGVAQAGMDHPLGMGVGYGLMAIANSGEMGHDLAAQAMTLTAAASDARMSGLNMTVMSSNGSGNNGLTAILPLAAYFEKHDVSEEQKIRALAMSHLINCYVKQRIGRLSAMCSCAISAATGSGAAIGWLMTGKVETVLGTIQNMTGNLSGMICDGAKEGCALKLATGAATGVQAALLASYGVVMPTANGIVGRSAEESIDHLGELSQRGMQLTDGVILDMMKRMV